MTNLLDILSCPACNHRLTKQGEDLVCQESRCRKSFPIFSGKPILLNEENSLFRTKDIIATKPHSPLKSKSLKTFLRMVIEILPEPKGNLKFDENLNWLVSQMRQKSEPKNVLLIGAGDTAVGLDKKFTAAGCRFVKSDVTCSEGIDLVCDAHNLPFADEAFDLVICQAVLEHVADPKRCVSEITRVLKLHGMVYAETPFIQQVHMGGRHDYTRFTPLGHRWLFRKFQEVKQGAVCGPAMALADSFKYFLFSFSQNKKYRGIIDILSRKILGWIKLFDYFLIDKPAAMDAASGVYFIGRKTDTEIPLKDLPNLYKGGL